MTATGNGWAMPFGPAPFGNPSLTAVHRRKVGRAKATLNDDQVAELRRLRRQGWKYADLAAYCGLELTATRFAVLGRSYKWVAEPPATQRRYPLTDK